MREWTKDGVFEMRYDHDHPLPRLYLFRHRNDQQVFRVRKSLDLLPLRSDDGYRRYIHDEMVTLTKEMDTYLDERCTCSMPPSGETCPVHDAVEVIGS